MPIPNSDPIVVAPTPFTADGSIDSDTLARTLHAIATRLDEIILRYDMAGVKGALDIISFEGMRPRAPLTAVSESSRQEITAALKSAGVI